MVYEGTRSKRKKGRSRSGHVFITLFWSLVLLVAAAAAFPGTAARVRDTLADALGVDIGGAMEAFSREAKENNVFSATRQAFRVAFATAGEEDMEALAGESQPTEPTEPESDPTEPPAPTQPLSFDGLALPKHVTEDKPRENLVLAGPLAGEVERPFGYFSGENGEPVFHYGLDVKGAEGSSVRCVAPGTVAAVGESAVFGRYVIVTHENGVESLYAMLGDTPLTEGQTLEAGQSVGALSGDTLHLELLIDGTYVNPQHYVYRNESLNG